MQSPTRSLRLPTLAAVAGVGLVLPLALVLLAGGRPADAHAVLISPQSRPWYDYLLRYNYNPHAVYGGGTMMVSDKEKLKWPAAHKYSICGDAYNERKWDKPGQIGSKGKYKAGATIPIDILFAQNHLGRVTIKVCPLDATSESACKSLQRADGKGTAWDLPWSGVWQGVVSGFVAPNYRDGTFETYKMPPTGKEQGCATWACDQFKGMYVYRTMWRLPAGFKCDHCKMQMTYLTASRCWPPEIKGVSLKKTVAYPYCGTAGASYPETFWNCADVTIR